MAAPKSSQTSPPTSTPNPNSFTTQISQLADTRCKLHRDLLQAKLRALRHSLQTPGNAPSTAAALDLARFTRALADQYPHYASLRRLPVRSQPPHKSIAHPSLLHDQSATGLHSSTSQPCVTVSAVPNLPLHDTRHASFPDSVLTITTPSLLPTTRSTHLSSPTPIYPSQMPCPPLSPTLSTSRRFQTRTYYINDINNTRTTEHRAPSAPSFPIPSKPSPTPTRNNPTLSPYNTSSYRFNIPLPHLLDSTPRSDAIHLAPGASPLFAFQTRTNYPFRLTYTPHLAQTQDFTTAVSDSRASFSSSALHLRVPLPHLTQPLLQLLLNGRRSGGFFDASGAERVQTSMMSTGNAGEEEAQEEPRTFVVGSDGYLRRERGRMDDIAVLDVV